MCSGRHAGGSIVGVLSDEEARAVRALPVKLQCLEASGLVVTPGFVDLHVHITGGGGEAGGSGEAQPALVLDMRHFVTSTESGCRLTAVLKFQVSDIGVQPHGAHGPKPLAQGLRRGRRSAGCRSCWTPASRRWWASRAPTP